MLNKLLFCCFCLFASLAVAQTKHVVVGARQGVSDANSPQGGRKEYNVFAIRIQNDQLDLLYKSSAKTYQIKQYKKISDNRVVLITDHPTKTFCIEYKETPVSNDAKIQGVWMLDADKTVYFFNDEQPE